MNYLKAVLTFRSVLLFLFVMQRVQADFGGDHTAMKLWKAPGSKNHKNNTIFTRQNTGYQHLINKRVGQPLFLLTLKKDKYEHS